MQTQEKSVLILYSCVAESPFSGRKLQITVDPIFFKSLVVEAVTQACKV